MSRKPVEKYYFFQQRTRKCKERFKKQLDEQLPYIKTPSTVKGTAYSGRETDSNITIPEETSIIASPYRGGGNVQPEITPIQPAGLAISGDKPHRRLSNVTLSGVPEQRDIFPGSHTEQIVQQTQPAKSFQEPNLSGWDSQRDTYNEVRPLASPLLSELTSLLYSKEWSGLPRSIHYPLLASWRQLVADACTEIREWQTQLAKDAARAKFEKDMSRGDSDSTSTRPDKYRFDFRSSSILSDAGGLMKPPRTAKRQKTDTESLEKEDRIDELTAIQLPTDHLMGGQPTIAKTATAPIQMVRRPSRKMSSSVRRSVTSGIEGLDLRSELIKSHEPKQSAYTYIQFLYSSKDCAAKGWISEPGNAAMLNVLEWARIRLQVSIKQKTDSDEHENDRGYLATPAIVLFGEPKDKLKGPRRKATSARMVANVPMKPFLEWQNPGGRRIWQTISNDGTTTVFYPDGGIALLWSHAGVGRTGFNLHVFDEVSGRPGELPPGAGRGSGVSLLLACFTPTGLGGVYFKDGTPRFVAMETYCTEHNERGGLVRRFRWPSPTYKLPASVIIRLNTYMTFRCASKTDMTLTYEADGSIVTFDIGSDLKTSSAGDMELDDGDYLVSGIPFISQTAKELLKPPKMKRSKGKSQKKPDKYKTQTVDSRKESDLEMLEKIDENPLAKELVILKKKARTLCESWLGHYRTQLGIQETVLTDRNDRPRIRQPHLRPSTSGYPIRGRAQTAQGSSREPKNHLRVPSAPAPLQSRPITAGSSILRGSTPLSVKFDLGQPRIIEPDVGVADEYGDRSKSQSTPLDWCGPIPCPQTTLAMLMGVSVKGCQCSRTKVPYIGDLELDYFLQVVTPAHMIVIVGIVNTQNGYEPKWFDLFERLYTESNRARRQPCSQARLDDYRLLLYDISSAANITTRTQALLLRRHNVQPGMVLIYMGGQLRFGDCIFNGYGLSQRDLMEQIRLIRSCEDSGFALPLDYRFSYDKESRRWLSASNGITPAYPTNLSLSDHLADPSEGKVSPVIVKSPKNSKRLDKRQGRSKTATLPHL